MGIFDFFRRKKKRPRLADQKDDQPDWKVTLKEDPYDGKVQQALGLKEEGKEEQAKRLLQQIIEEKEEHVRAWFLLAEIFMDIDEKGRALYCYERVVEYQPTNGHVQELVQRLETVVRRRPDYLWEYNKEKGLI